MARLMNNAETQNNRFLKHAYKLADSVWGAVALDAMSPYFAANFNPIENSQTAQNYLEKLGYDPQIFKEFAEHPVHVLSRDMQGFFSAVGVFKSSFILKKFMTGSHNAASLSNGFMRAGTYKNHQFLLMPDLDGFEYTQLLSRLSGIPSKFLGDMQEDKSPLLALIMAHEIGHYGHYLPINADHESILQAEIEADRFALQLLSRIETDENCQKAINRLMHARASGAIIFALQAMQKPDIAHEQIAHATALALGNDAGDINAQEIFDANWAIVKLLENYNRSKAMHAPLFIKTYQSADEILQNHEKLNPLQRLVLERYKQSIEFFCPVKAALALRPDQASSIMLLDNQGPH